MKRILSEFLEDLDECLFILNEIIHGRFSPTPDVLLPPVREVEPDRSCPKADLSAAEIMNFLKTQKRTSNVFSTYMDAEKQREVNTDG